MIAFQRDVSQVLENDIPGLQENLKKVEKEFTIASFWRNALRKRNPVTYSQEEARLKFSQVEGNIKAFLVNPRPPPQKKKESHNFFI